MRKTYSRSLRAVVLSATLAAMTSNVWGFGWTGNNTDFMDWGYAFDNLGPFITDSGTGAADRIHTYTNQAPGYNSIYATPSTPDSGLEPGVTNVDRFADMNANGTPWFQFSFIDRKNPDGTWPRIRLYWNGPQSNPIATPAYQAGTFGTGWAVSGILVPDYWTTEAGTGIANAVNSFGSLGPFPATDSNEYNGFMASELDATNGHPSYAVSTGEANLVEDSTYGGIGANNPNNWINRIDGEEVTVRIGKLTDGTMEYTLTLDGNTYIWQSEWFKNSGEGTFDIYQIEITVTHALYGASGGSPASLTFTDFLWGGDYTEQIPEPASFALLALAAPIIMLRRKHR